jgi:hypothetical protein
VGNDNIKNYVSKETLERVNYAVEHASFKVFKQTISDIWRLALLYEHGGIYVDSTTFTME